MNTAPFTNSCHLTISALANAILEGKSNDRSTYTKYFRYSEPRDIDVTVRDGQVVSLRLRKVKTHEMRRGGSMGLQYFENGRLVMG